MSPAMDGAGSLIEGRVHRADGSPVAEARVFITSGPVPTPDIAQLTDQEGRFTLFASAPGSYEIGCHAEGLAPARVEAVADGTDVIQVDIEMTAKGG